MFFTTFGEPFTSMKGQREPPDNWKQNHTSATKIQTYPPRVESSECRNQHSWIQRNLQTVKAESNVQILSFHLVVAQHQTRNYITNKHKLNPANYEIRTFESSESLRPDKVNPTLNRMFFTSHKFCRAFHFDERTEATSRQVKALCISTTKIQTYPPQVESSECRNQHSWIQRNLQTVNTKSNLQILSFHLVVTQHQTRNYTTNKHKLNPATYEIRTIESSESLSPDKHNPILNWAFHSSERTKGTFGQLQTDPPQVENCKQ